MTLFYANTRVLDRCLDRAVYRIFGVCDKVNVSSWRTLLGLHRISNLVKNRRVKFLDGLLDTGSVTRIYCINCLGYYCIPVLSVSVCFFLIGCLMANKDI